MYARWTLTTKEDRWKVVFGKIYRKIGSVDIAARSTAPNARRRMLLRPKSHGSSATPSPSLATRTGELNPSSKSESSSRPEPESWVRHPNQSRVRGSIWSRVRDPNRSRVHDKSCCSTCTWAQQTLFREDSDKFLIVCRTAKRRSEPFNNKIRVFIHQKFLFI